MPPGGSVQEYVLPCTAEDVKQTDGLGDGSVLAVMGTLQTNLKMWHQPE